METKPILWEAKTKPNAVGILWKEIKNKDMPPYNKEEWLTQLTWIIEEIENKNWQ